MTESCTERKALSLKLCHVLDYVGLSARMRKVWMDYGLVTEAFLALRTHLMQRPLDLFKFGSGIEGSTIPGLHSDLDILLLHPIPVIERLCDAPESGKCYLLVCDPDTPAGFVKFQVVQDGQMLTESDRGKVQPEEHYDVDQKGRLVRNNMTTLQDRLNNATRSGPAQTCEDKNFGSIDYVESYHCSTWPEVASEWLRTQRSKTNNGTNDTHLAEMEAQGCFFVGIGHPKSKEAHLEWRISLSSQERNLMFNLTPIQFKCYVMLKIIKEEFIKPKTGKSISSYHCKTAVFHVVEREKASFWTEENLLMAVFHCINLLLEWIRKDNCPNYFVRKENMFDGKIEGELKKQVEKALEDIHKGERIILDIECDKVGELMCAKDGMKEGKMSVKAWENLYRIHLDTVCEFHQSAERIKGLYAGDPDPQKCTDALLKLMNKLMDMTSYGLHDKSGIVNAVKYFTPCAKVCYGSNLIACALKEGCKAKEDLIEQGFKYIENGMDCYYLSGRLKFASCLFALGKIDKCLEILTDLESTLCPTSTTTCACRHIEYNINESLVQNLVTDIPSTQKLAETSVCLCVSFQPSEMDLAPFPLRYEMYRSFGTPENSVGGFGVYWYPSACVDAKVYLYFLKYLVHDARNEHGMKMACIDKMLGVVDEDGALKHTETAYNLLAWVSQREGQPGEAIKYCRKSWEYLVNIEDKCTSSVHPHHNAVKWHVVSVLNDVWQRQRR